MDKNRRSLRTLLAARPTFTLGLPAVLALVSVMLMRTASQADGPILVNTTKDESTSGDSLCSLREAINNANAQADTSGGDCAAGTGNDAINFTVSGTITLVASKGSLNIQHILGIDGGRVVTVDGASAARVFSVTGALDLQNITVTHGGIYNNGTLTVANSTFSGSNSTSFGDPGGAVRNGSGGTLAVANSTFSGNTSSSGGGIFNGGSLTVSNSTFSGNAANGSGGGIFNERSLTITNGTFLGNNASSGGGIFNNNSSDAVRVSNSILAGSEGGNCANNLIGVGSNISDDGSCRFGTSTGLNGKALGDNVVPRLDSKALQDNGGPTRTIALQPTSPAIDAIPIAKCPSTDERGAARPDPEDKRSAKPACDVGAFESGGVPPTRSPNPVTLSINFGTNPVGSTTAPQSMQLSNNQKVALTLSSIGITGPNSRDFIISPRSTCGSTLGANKACLIMISFKPLAKGRRSGTLLVRGSPDPVSPETMSLAGTGQ